MGIVKTESERIRGGNRIIETGIREAFGSRPSGIWSVLCHVCLWECRVGFEALGTWISLNGLCPKLVTFSCFFFFLLLNIFKYS